MRAPILATAALLAAVATAATAQQGKYDPFVQASGAPVPAFVTLCATGSGRLAVPCGGTPGNPLYVMSMPFVRATQDVNRFEGVSTTAKTFAISRPAGATSYRFVNPCDVDVRIRKVDTAQQVITSSQGTLFLARTSETLGTSDPQFVSLIAMSEPSRPCAPELGYGNGG